MTSFTVATNRRYTTAEGEQREETEWFTVSAWNRLGETINQYLTKGRRVYVEGRLKSSTWTGNDGETRFRNEITANQILMLDRERSTEDEPNTPNHRYSLLSRGGGSAHTPFLTTQKGFTH